MLDDRKLGPYDRRTIVGMRIKKTLTSDHVLLGTDGSQLTVRDLIGRREKADFQPQRTGNFSLVQATYPASLRFVAGQGMAIPAFKGEIEVRVQTDVLRVAGRFRQGLGWKDDRVKLPLQDIVHARVQGTEVELGLRSGASTSLQRIRLELFTPEAAGELADWLPAAKPWPTSIGQDAPAGNGKLLWAAVAATAAVLTALVAVALARRF
jgi:hypothetical protein